MRHFVGDVRYALRHLAKSPGWTAAAVATLAIGVGANTTVFSWTRAVLLEPLAGVSDQSRIHQVSWRNSDGEAISTSYPDFRDLAALPGIHDGLWAQRAAFAALGSTTPGESPRRIYGGIVSGNYFDVLGVRPASGRGFAPDEDRGEGSPPVAVVSHGLWKSAFASDPEIVGRSILLNGQPFAIVGVSPDGFHGTFLGTTTDFWVPMAQSPKLDPGGNRFENRGDRWLVTFARLRPGVTAAQADGVMRAEAARLAKEFPDSNRGHSVALLPLWKSETGAPQVLRPVLIALAGLVGLVLLLACANVANLLLGRALGRRREVAVRLALGASRRRLVAQLLTESLLLALLATGAALMTTVWSSGLLMRLVPPTGVPLHLDLRVDGLVLLYGVLVAAVATALSGLVPALQGTRSVVASDLKEEGPAAGTGRSRARLRSALVVAQVALSLALILVAGLFLRSLSESRKLSPGFQPDHLLFTSIDLFPLGYDAERGLAFQEALIEAARALPGVERVSMARRIPLGFGGTSSSGVAIDGYTPRADEEVNILFNNVMPGYFETMEIPVRAGRAIDARDRKGAPLTVVVNETFAKRYLAGRDPLASRVRYNQQWRAIVGVVADGKYRSLSEPPTPYFYLPLAQVWRPQTALHLRTSGEPLAVVPALRAAMARLDPNLPISEVQTGHQHMDEALIAPRLASSLLGVVGVLALLLAAVGLSAVLAWSVAQRRRELGVRMAMGASPGDVVRQIVAGGLRMALWGAAIGTAAGLMLARLVRSQLHGVGAADPAALAAAILLMALVALIASWVPARRASRVSPTEALRQA
jgi:predicted permease